MSNDFGRIVRCERCKGTGTVAMGISRATCPACNGSGKQRID